MQYRYCIVELILMFSYNPMILRTKIILEVVVKNQNNNDLLHLDLTNDLNVLCRNLSTNDSPDFSCRLAEGYMGTSNRTSVTSRELLRQSV